MNANSIKQLNKRRVLQYIQRHQGHSRADIAKSLEISKPTISNLVDELLAEGWIREKESLKASSSGGRKPYQIFFIQDAAYLIGVDIGGTSVEMAVMDLAGNVQKKSCFPTQGFTGEKLTPKIAEAIRQLIQQCGLQENQVFGAGVGVPGITDVSKGMVIDAPSVGWKNVPLKSALESLLPFPIYIDNDVNVAVLGELWKGTSADKDNMLMITLGTGIGCGIIIHGELYRGATYAAGEIGYMVTDKNMAEKHYEQTFAGYGFLDSHVGGPAIANRMKMVEKQAAAPTAKQIFQQAADGNEKAVEILEESLSHLAFALINVISIINPGRIILGGGISKSMHRFLPILQSTIERHVPVQTAIAITEVEDVSLIGAGYLLLKEHDSVLKV
ncbi:ROK family transcriptional regulator [Virgibacillus xinjiangensis]|uniref:ROK family transcriptional regulator n=1 Tax=Virgibacillus xinjiangensis TaxID=393090 RepID=A0ABV7CU89_9BACI